MASCPPSASEIDETGFGYTLSLINGKYKMAILYWLSEHGVLRYSQLKRDLGAISHKTLSLLTRKEYPQIPPKVEYSLSEMGRSLIPILDAMCQWGEDHRRDTEA